MGRQELLDSNTLADPAGFLKIAILIRRADFFLVVRPAVAILALISATIISPSAKAPFHG